MKRSYKYELWLETKEGEEFKERQAKRAHERWLDPEDRKSRTEAISKGGKRRHANHTEEEKIKWGEDRKGDKNARWEAIKVVAKLRSGEVKEYIFEGNQPFTECCDTIGLHNVIVKLKNGEQHVVKSKRNKQQWPIGTIVTIESITK